jgi:putative transcriptional regulator
MKNGYLVSIGNKIKTKRAEINITQTELALRMCKDKQFLERIENGKVNTTVLSILEIAIALNCNPCYFLDNQETLY